MGFSLLASSLCLYTVTEDTVFTHNIMLLLLYMLFYGQSEKQNNSCIVLLIDILLLHGIVLYCIVAWYCIVLYCCVVLHCIVAWYCIVLLHGIVLYCIVAWYCIVSWYFIVLLHGIVLYCSVVSYCCMVLYCTIAWYHKLYCCVVSHCIVLLHYYHELPCRASAICFFSLLSFSSRVAISLALSASSSDMLISCCNNKSVHIILNREGKGDRAFSSVALFVFLFVCYWHYWKGYEWITMKFHGGVWGGKRNKWHDFYSDPD